MQNHGVGTVKNMDSSQGAKVDLGKSFCLFDGKHFVKLHVTPEATEEEVQNVVLLRGALPRLKLQTLGPSTETPIGTSFLALGSRICCVACSETWPNNKVKMFDPNAKQLKFDNLFPDMNEKRTFPAVAAIGGLIYVFGGLRYDEHIDPERIWAEYLDTSQPRDKQAWMPLPKPPFPLQHDMLFSFPLGDEQILVFDNNLTKNGFLYDVKDRSWTEYKFMDKDTDGDWVREPLYLLNPILDGHKTVYWLFGHVFCAFELESKKLYRGFVKNSVLPDYRGDFPLLGVPSNAVLMHLKDDVFCFFTFYYKYFGPDNKFGVLECTKIRVAKTDGPLKIDVIGYQSYHCGDMWTLNGGVSISKSLNGSKKRRNRHREKHNH